MVCAPDRGFGPAGAIVIVWGCCSGAVAGDGLRAAGGFLYSPDLRGRRPPVPTAGGCATLRLMDQADSVLAGLGAPGNVFYFVADLAAAAAWYSARLGTGPVTRASQLVMFDLPGVRLTLHEADQFNQPGPSGTVPYWTVSDVDATVAEWSQHGASAHRGPKTIMTGERLCQMLDPFGNLFGLRQPPA